MSHNLEYYRNILQDTSINLLHRKRGIEAPSLQYNIGKWSRDEHLAFIFGIIKYGNDWGEIEHIVKTRTSTQSRSHSQKFFRWFKELESDEIPYKIGNAVEFKKVSKSMNKTKMKKLIEKTILFSDYDANINLEDNSIFIHLYGQQPDVNKGKKTCLNDSDKIEFPNLYAFASESDVFLWKMNIEKTKIRPCIFIILFRPKTYEIYSCT
jgi:SHAQKYF class myb-like DNA-binding protein